MDSRFVSRSIEFHHRRQNPHEEKVLHNILQISQTSEKSVSFFPYIVMIDEVQIALARYDSGEFWFNKACIAASVAVKSLVAPYLCYLFPFVYLYTVQRDIVSLFSFYITKIESESTRRENLLHKLHRFNKIVKRV